MLRQVKPRNARSKRALEKREPKVVENPKTCLFLRGTTCSQVVQDAMTDLHSMRQPLAKKFTKKNPIHPFDDATSLEFFSEKNDASLMVFGSSSKKRPHTLTFVRTFGFKVLDMLELYLDAGTFRSLAQFPTRKFAVGLRPMVLFAGTAFESPVDNEYSLAKNILLDFFRGEPSDRIDVEGLQYMVSITAEEEEGYLSAPAPAGTGDLAVASSGKPKIHLRTYLIRTRRSGQRLPRIEVEEMGPRMDFRVGRLRLPDEATLKDAMRKPRGTEERTKKNITTDSMGDKIGRVHLGKQDLGDLQTRKMKGLKRSREDKDDGAAAEPTAVDEAQEDAKRIRQ
ncbi:ribosome production factor 2 [Geosmithia morbida]|uniref:Ribosome production factor 2 homolog n=1 Tax=Geosmithia morbida TaxID=1094350 RepID=A0A9P5D3G5_9HYPO|nr:ribosome production factor 2 [Geosmithia morbida]KAF4122521.1 ribosome production factor 2 [Geosmithia morbida]